MKLNCLKGQNKILIFFKALMAKIFDLNNLHIFMYNYAASKSDDTISIKVL